MDSKMDSGCLAPGESLDDEYDFTRQLLPSEVIGIIDQLLCLEVGSPIGLGCAKIVNMGSDGMAPGIPSIPNSAHQCLH
jgi:hypothetical protein